MLHKLLLSMLHKVLQNIKNKDKLKLFYEMSITLIPTPDKNIIIKESYEQFPLWILMQIS